MRKRSRIALALLLLAVVGGIAWLTLRSNEPMYKGKWLSEWLADYDVAFGWGPMAFGTVPESDEAVRHIGTNAIPTLLRRLRTKHSPLTIRLAALAQKQHVFKVNLKREWILQEEGLCGFRALGSAGKDAVPELIRMYQEHSPESDYPVAAALGFIGPVAEQAVPALVWTLRDTKSDSCLEAFAALRRIHARPEIAVPALIKCLSDHELQIRREAAETLGVFGSDAKSAVPSLLKVLADPHEYNIKEEAKEALMKIDPEAAARVGVK